MIHVKTKWAEMYSDIREYMAVLMPYVFLYRKKFKDKNLSSQ